MKPLTVILIIVMLSGCATTATHTSLNEGKSLPELIPVRDFVANRGSNWAYQISPDGKKLAWVAVKGVSLYFFIKDLEHSTIRTFPAGNFYGGFEWAQDSRRLIFAFQQGDENSAYVTLDTEQSEDKAQWVQITPGGGVKAFLIRQIPNDPAHVLIAHNQRDKTIFDLYKIDINTKESTLVAENPGNATAVLTSPQGELKGYIVKQENAYTLELLQADASSYKPFYQWTSADSVQFVSIDDTGGKLYLLSNKNRDRLVLIELSISSGEERLVYEDPAVDISNIYTHPVSGKPLFAFTDPGYPKAVLLDPSLKTSFAFLKDKVPARFSIQGSDRRFHLLILTLSTDKGSEWYLYDLEHGRMEKLGSSPSQEHATDLADMSPIEFASRDHIPLRGYLTLPKGVAPHRLPMVLWVHGGPWGRDVWGYNPNVQFYANRGYAVLQINYRGSTGYGRRFEEMAIGEFAGKMQDDLLDGVQWAIDKGIADAGKIAIAGGSYGGYATLVGLSFTPDTFACGIDIFGPTDLVKLVEDFPPYWKFEMDRWHQYVGDPSKPADRLVMQAKSPLFKADNITKPLLVIQGRQDVRVKADQSIRLVNKLRESHKQVDFWLISGAGHGILHWPQRLTEFRKTEDFLSGCLGGRSSNFDFYQLGSWLF
jgi:dipeptidyl aminopeptidase/acylaminoacyl peptidase